MSRKCNQEAYSSAQRATLAPNFHEARAILATIVLERISDPDVAKYIDYCNDLAEYCIEHGIQRSADLNLFSVLRMADKSKVSVTLKIRWWQKGMLGPVVSAIDGGWLAFRLSGWLKLQEKLDSRYS